MRQAAAFVRQETQYARKKHAMVAAWTSGGTACPICPGPGGESHPWMTDSVFEGAPTILEEFER